MTTAQTAALSELLNDIAEHGKGDPEAAHAAADKALLDYIGDDAVTEAFNAIEKWYS